jgi:hypothetical protein
LEKIFYFYNNPCIVKPAHTVTCIKRSPFLSCHRTFHMNWSSFKKSLVWKGHFSLSQRWPLNTGLTTWIFWNNKYRFSHEQCIHYPLVLWYSKGLNRIGGVMVSVLASSEVDRGFEPRSVQTKDYEIGICYFSAKHASSRRKSKDGLARYQNNVSEWNDMSTCGLLFQWSSTIKIQLCVLV